MICCLDFLFYDRAVITKEVLFLTVQLCFQIILHVLSHATAQ